MITRKLKIKSISDADFVKQKRVRYSYAFRKIYKNFEKVKDPLFRKFILDEFGMDSWD